MKEISSSDSDITAALARERLHFPNGGFTQPPLAKEPRNIKQNINTVTMPSNASEDSSESNTLDDSDSHLRVEDDIDPAASTSSSGHDRLNHGAILSADRFSSFSTTLQMPSLGTHKQDTAIGNYHTLSTIQNQGQSEMNGQHLANMSSYHPSPGVIMSSHTPINAAMTVMAPSSSPPVGEEVARKREMRLLKNREAARECRRKKKEYVKCLEERVAVLEDHNKQLMNELKTLKELYCGNVVPGTSGSKDS